MNQRLKISNLSVNDPKSGESNIAGRLLLIEIEHRVVTLPLNRNEIYHARLLSFPTCEKISSS